MGTNELVPRFIKSKLLENYCLGDRELLFKMIIIGDPTVGKTSFVQRSVKNDYRYDYKGTIGVDFALKTIPITNNKSIKIQMWDIAGQERFTWMTGIYYRSAHGCIIMFDITNKNTLANAAKWKEDVDSKCFLQSGEPIPCILLGNKCDLLEREVHVEEIASFQKLHKFSGWAEVSAKDNYMVEEAIEYLLSFMINEIPTVPLEKGFRLVPELNSSTKSCSC